ncbi:major facilitator superfamily domain-containing protein [Massariosphaeria phaeospora]|uniref:Major facilitator superfamily domain-containing protein n=1 Tax=Massariosphaeria phaeospora TaxID=100035 RepID=A0A7C8M2F4_9PLEO|nr:major facilitator superfamily domain-containing protein [Massariosphaeria phaeospora]
MRLKWKPKETADNNNPHDAEKATRTTGKWHLGILADRYTDEVPGSVILLSGAHKRNEPLGLQHSRARTSTSSLPSPYGTPRSRSASRGSSRSVKFEPLEKKRTKDGKFILEPQPEDSANDPLNWSGIRRDIALVSLGFYCMVGGGMTPVLAAGFNNVAETYNVSVPKVALTTGLYMLGLGLGSVVASPTAILWGKRPVYLGAIILFLISSIWCAVSPNYISLLIARIVQGFAVSPVECLPSATVAEIFFLHERAYRLGIYTLLLLGGKNLIPLVSAAIVQSLGWRWVFWIVAIVVAGCFVLIFMFVPETFWDRTPEPKKHQRFHMPSLPKHHTKSTQLSESEKGDLAQPSMSMSGPSNLPRPAKVARVGFAADPEHDALDYNHTNNLSGAASSTHTPVISHCQDDCFHGGRNGDHLGAGRSVSGTVSDDIKSNPEKDATLSLSSQTLASQDQPESEQALDQASILYTDYYRIAPPKSYVQSLRPWNGRLAKDKWIKVMIRPFILFAYPAVLWSSMVYALAVGWLIVLSESVAHIYQNHESYNFTALQVGMVYISPFVGGVLGTAVAGKISDIVVRFMARKNDGVYEPEFRLIMAIPIAISTTIGLMGFGWSAEEKDNWAVPTVFFGVISFGCCLASTTAVTFVVDSYRVYAGEALVTLNFSKNILHGLIFSLFFPHWLESSGSKSVFLAVGGIQMACMLFTIPMYIYGKRARMWTVRKNLMENF